MSKDLLKAIIRGLSLLGLGVFFSWVAWVTWPIIPVAVGLIGLWAIVEWAWN